MRNEIVARLQFPLKTLPQCLNRDRNRINLNDHQTMQKNGQNTAELVHYCLYTTNMTIVVMREATYYLLQYIKEVFLNLLYYSQR